MGRRKKGFTVENLWDFSDLLRRLSPSHVTESSSEESTDEDREPKSPASELRDMEEQFKKALLSNDQLDKEKQIHSYQIEALKDDIQELQENYHRIQKDHRELNSNHNLLVRDHKELKNDLKFKQELISSLEKLISDHGLVLVKFDEADPPPPAADGHEVTQNNNNNHVNSNNNHVQPSSSTSSSGTTSSSMTPTDRLSEARSSSVFSSSVGVLPLSNNHRNHDGQNSNSNAMADDGDEVESTIGGSSTCGDAASTINGSNRSRSTSVMSSHPLFSGPILMSRDIIQLIESFEGMNLESKLKCMAEEREDLIHEIQRLRFEIQEYQQKIDRLSSNDHHNTKDSNLNGNNELDTEYDNKKLIHEYKFRLKKAEQDIVNLQRNNARLETSLARFKQQAEEAEKLEDELKTEKRKILRELRENQTRVEELETANSHLAKRIDKLKETRMAAIIGSSTAPTPNVANNNGSPQ